MEQDLDLELLVAMLKLELKEQARSFMVILAILEVEVGSTVQDLA